MKSLDANRRPLIPGWAAPSYLLVAAIAATGYLLFDLTSPGLPGLAVMKASGIVLLALYAMLRGAPVLALALIFSAGGDYALALGPSALPWGILSFGLAHLVYLGIFLVMMQRDGWRRDGLILAAALALFGVAMLSWIRPGLGELAVPVTVYNGIILLMAMAAGLVKGPRLIVVGALLFVISDSVIAARMFRDVLTFDALDWGGVIVWTTYVAAQFCLTIGISRAQDPASGAGAAALPAKDSRI